MKIKVVYAVGVRVQINDNFSSPDFQSRHTPLLRFVSYGVNTEEKVKMNDEKKKTLLLNSKDSKKNKTFKIRTNLKDGN